MKWCSLASPDRILRLAWPTTVAVLALTACQPSGTPQGPSAPPEGSVSFAVRQPAGAAETVALSRGGVPANTSKSQNVAIQDAAYVLVTLESDLGEPLANWQARRIDLHTFGSEFMTAPQPLAPASYRMALFVVYDRQDMALFATPRADSERSYLVEHPLPIEFRIEPDATTTVAPEVIPVQTAAPAEFGYASFLPEVVPSITFQLVTMLWQEETSSFAVTDASLTVSHQGLPERTQNIPAAVTVVEVRDLGDSGEYTLTVTKQGYEPLVQTRTGEELKAYSNTPMILILRPPPPAQDDACSTPWVLDLGTTEVVGSTVGAANNHAGSCQPLSGSEVAYQLQVEEAGRYVFHAAGYDTVLYLRQSCQDASTEIVCDDDSGGSLSALITAELTPGTYFLFVDGYDGLGGEFQLIIDMLCPAGALLDPVTGECVDDPCEPNPCTSANKEVCVPLLPDSYECQCNQGFIVDPDNPEACVPMPTVEGDACGLPYEITAASGVLEGTTMSANGDAAGSCGGNGADHVYAFTVPQRTLVDFSMTGYDTVLHLRTTCDDQSSEIACDDDGGESTTARLATIVEPGTYYLWADSYSNGSAYALRFSLTPDPCQPGSCQAPFACVPSPDWLSFTCECPAGAVPFEDSCIDDPCEPNPCGDNGPLNICVPQLPDSYQCACNPGYECPENTLIHLETCTCVDDPCEPNPCTQALREVCVPVLPDAYECECNDYYMEDPSNPEACIPDPAAQGESCVWPTALEVGTGVIEADMSASFNDAHGSCGGHGPDQVYEFVVSDLTRAQFLMQGYDTTLHIRAICDDAGTEVGCDDDGGEGSNARLVAILEPGTYYLWADSFGVPGQAFELHYNFQPNPCESDSCPDTFACVPTNDWTAFTCECPAGMVAFEDVCVDDPCEPNPCAENALMHMCVAELPESYHCECGIGYVPEPTSPTGCVSDPRAAEWAFVVFLNADNNLESFGFDDISEMGTAAIPADVKVVALFDTMEGPAIVIDINQNHVETVEEWGEMNMGDWRTLERFGDFVLDKYPSRHYAFIMWDHGSGWRGPGRRRLPVFKGFSDDWTGENHEISVAGGEFSSAMGTITNRLGRKIDLLGFDACLMGMWEVATTSSPFADYLVASSEVEPATGWPYNGFMPTLAENANTTTGETLGRAIVDAYAEAGGNNQTLALTDLGKIGQVDQALNELATALLALPALHENVELVRGTTQGFTDYEARDLRDFAERLLALEELPEEVRSQATGLIEAIEGAVVHNRAQQSHPGSHGLSIYFPARQYGTDALYGTSVWHNATAWDEFLRAFAASE